jgi:glycosyltransferase involved in cell wall biosynthesis
MRRCQSQPGTVAAAVRGAAADTLRSMRICTVAARHELDSARALALSFRRIEPAESCTTLVIDDSRHELAVGDEPFDLVWPESLSIGAWRKLVAGYEEPDLRRAVQPWLLAYLLHHPGGGNVLYVGPNAEVVGPLGELDRLIDEHLVVVSDRLVGFAAHDAVRRLLAGWITRLEANSLMAPEWGYLIDRRWLDSVPRPATLDDAGRFIRSTVENKPDPHSYGWSRLPDGTLLDAAGRRAYRDGIIAGALADDDVFSASGAEAFVAHLRGPGKHRGLSRYLEALHAARQDIQARFPDLDGVDAVRLAAWARSAGVARGEVVATLLSSSDAGAPPVAGVNVAGYFQGVMGVGEHSRQLVAALRTQGIAVTATTLRPEASPEDDALGTTDESSASPGFDAGFNLLSANADSVPHVAERLGAEFFADRFTIGFWAWEVSTFPDRFQRAFGYLDEVWVGSRHVREAVASAATVPVVAIPQPVSVAPGPAKPPPELPAGGFRFLFAFDYLSVFERKNPLGVIEAFARAFAPGSGASLIIKSLNEGHDPSARDRLRGAAAAHPDIHVFERRLSAAERDGLLSAADCFISLHRAEGFGYTMAEAMWLGKPVIATAYSGNLEFMTASNSFLVANRLIPIGGGHQPYPAEGVWAQPDLDHAASQMRDVFEHREEAQRRGARGAREIRARHSPDAAGRAMRERLELLMGQPALRQQGKRRQPGPRSTEEVQHRLRAGPMAPPRSRFGASQRAARRALLRLLKPVTVHQRLVDDALARAIDAMDGRMQSVTASQAAVLRRLDDMHDELSRIQEDVQRSGRS